jgi:hypothetical protein
VSDAAALPDFASWKAAAVPTGGPSIAVDGLTPAAWDRLTGRFADVNRFQTAAYADGLRGPGRMSHLVLLRNGDPVAGARVALMRPPGLPVGVAYVKGGPFWRRHGRAADPDVYREILAALWAEYGDRRGLCLTVCPSPHPDYQEVEAALLRESGFRRNRDGAGNDSFLMRLGPDAEGMRADLSQKWRYNLKLAERNGLAVRFRDPMEALPEFHLLHDALIARKRFIDREALHTLPALFRQLPPERVLVATVAHDGETVAAAIVIAGGDVAHYLFGATADAGLSLRAGYALHWGIACRLAASGAAWYDLGAGIGNPGLRLFKQGLVGRSGRVLASAGEFDHAATPRAVLGGRLLYGLRDIRVRASGLHERARTRLLAGLRRVAPARSVAGA